MRSDGLTLTGDIATPYLRQPNLAEAIAVGMLWFAATFLEAAELPGRFRPTDPPPFRKGSIAGILSSMPERLTPRQRFLNRLFAIPTVAQWWARTRAAETQGLADISGEIPFAPLRKPLRQCTGVLITTAGVHLRSQPPFDLENPDGDASSREIPGTTPDEELVISHKYYDHRDADQDLNVVFPLDHFRALAAQGVIGAVAPHHFGFMGHIDGPLLEQFAARRAPEVAARLPAPTGWTSRS